MALKREKEIMSEVNDYHERKVAIVKPQDNNGIGVITVWVHDFDCYETAIEDADDIHEVQRYATYEKAMEGHKRWIEKTKTLEHVKALSNHLFDTPEHWVLLRRVKK